MNKGVVWNGRLASDTAAQTWSEAVRSYRESLDTYRHVLSLRARRAASLRQPMPVATIEAPAPAAIARQPIHKPANLTGRECEVASLLVLGYTNAQIAESLVITHGTTANHVAHILAKLGVVNRSQAVARLLQGSGG